MILLFFQNHAGCIVTKFRRKTLRFVIHEYLLPHGSFCLHKTRGNSFQTTTGRQGEDYQKRIKARFSPSCPAHPVFVNILGTDAGSNQYIPLKINRLKELPGIILLDGRNPSISVNYSAHSFCSATGGGFSKVRIPPICDASRFLSACYNVDRVSNCGPHQV